MGDNSTIILDPEVFANSFPEGSASLAAVVSALVPALTAGLVLVGVFTLVRQRFPVIYAPRTFLGTIPEKDRTPSAGPSYLGWLQTLRTLPDKFILYHESLDAYLYLRFLRTIIFICVAGCCFTWPVLMPVNATGGGSSTELDKITISNVTKTNHLYAHAVMAWVFLGFVMYTITKERLWLIGLRQAWTLSTPHAQCLSARTVLFLSAPKDSLVQSNINRFFGDAAVRIWPVTNPERLQTLVSERNILVEKLESAEAVFIHKANSRKARGSIEDFNGSRITFADLPDLVKMAMRLRSKPKTFPFFSLFGFPYSKKEDTIQSLRDEIKQKEEQIEEKRQGFEIGEPHGAAAVFVEFKTQADAQRARQQVASSNPMALMPRYTDVKPNEIIWDNLTIPPVRRISEEGMANTLVAMIIIFWSIPSGLVGVVSNISYLAENVEWLHFLKDLPDSVIGLLSGLLPPLLTSLLSKDLPLIFRRIFVLFGSPTRAVNELKVQRWAYVFQVTQVFMVTAVFSGAATVASQLKEQLKDPTGIPTLLATQLPKSSNYYLTYFILQGTTSAADNLFSYASLFKYLSAEYLVDETPRQKFKRYTTMQGIAWCKVFPKFTNFAVIAIAYSCIAPLVLGFAAAGLFLYYLSYRYNLIYVVQPKIDTKGQAYTLALQQLITGVYIAELVLIGFFGLRKAKGPSIITGVLFIVTIVYTVLMNKYMAPLEETLPAELVSTADRDDETTPLLSSTEEGRGSTTTTTTTPTDTSALMPYVFKSVERFFDSRASHGSMKSWIVSDKDDFDIDEQCKAPEYTDEELKRAYLHPALTAPTPVIWMARDPMEASKNEVSGNEESGLRASDAGAWLDERRIVHWDLVDFEKVPVWRRAVRY
ncbi:DUF221-domain-containing protein [Nemania sp. FL0916]|nr:DUF221-domain-containing protein [Nemania sp. FL0916]